MHFYFSRTLGQYPNYIVMILDDSIYKHSEMNCCIPSIGCILYTGTWFENIFKRNPMKLISIDHFSPIIFSLRYLYYSPLRLYMSSQSSHKS